MKKVNAEIQRTEGRVFVSVSPPKQVAVAPIAQQHNNWVRVADEIATDVSASETHEKDISPSPNGERSEARHHDDSDRATSESTIDEVFAESLPTFIEASRWGRYIFPGPASRIHDNTTFIYHNPCPNFWNLYELSKGIFRGLGIRLSKERGVWVANIPIRVLTDKMFIESGLEAVEKTLLVHTGMDPVAILNEIRERQYRETQEGIRKVKLGKKTGTKDVIGDAVGAIAIFAVSYLAFVVGGV